jgi:hypothetical protein
MGVVGVKTVYFLFSGNGHNHTSFQWLKIILMYVLKIISLVIFFIVFVDFLLNGVDFFLFNQVLSIFGRISKDIFVSKTKTIYLVWFWFGCVVSILRLFFGTWSKGVK